MKWPKIRWTIQKRLISLFLLSLTIFLAFAVLWIRWELQRERVDRAASLRRTATHIASRAQEVIGSIEQLLVGLTRFPEIMSLEPEPAGTLLRDHLSRYPALANLIALTSEGRLCAVAVVPPRGLAVSFADQRWFRQVRRTGRPTIASLRTGRSGDQPVIVVAVPIRDHAGSAAGVLGAIVKPHQLYERLSAIMLPKETLTLVDAAGMILAHAPEPHSWVGKRLADRALLSVLASGVPGAGEGLAAFDGTPRQVAYAPIQTGSLGALVSLPMTEVPSRLWPQARALLLPGVLILVLTTGIGLVITRQVRRPLRQLRQTISGMTLEEGRPISPVEIASTDEAGEMTSAINNLLERLETVRHQERRLVRELTTLNQIATAASRSLDLQEVLDQVLSLTLDALSMEGGAIHLLDEQSGMLVLTASRGLSARYCEEAQAISASEGFCGRAAETRTPLVVSDTRSPDDVQANRFAALEGARSMASLPLIARDRAVGVMSLITRQPRVLTEPEITLLSAIGPQLGAAIENARLYDAQRHAALHLEATVQERTRQLREALDRANEAARLKSEFLANMSHELRTPLNAAIGFSEVLVRQGAEPLTDSQARYVGLIHLASRHLLQMINDMLALSRVEAGRLQLRPTSFALNALLVSVVDTHRSQADAKGVGLTLHLGDDLVTLVADPLRVREIVSNLLGNAIKFTPNGGSVTVGARRIDRSQPTAGGEPSPVNREPHGDVVEIRVQDTGIGISAENLRRLFREFTQLDSSLAKRYQGVGVGLALTKRLVELHGGTVTVSSRGEGQGSTFTVTLPLRPPKTRGRVMIVEADAALRELIARSLEHAGFHVEQMEASEAALDRIGEAPPILLVLDLVLPDPGLALLRRLQRETRRFPVLVLISGDVTRPDELEALGADEFLTKPFSSAVLVDLAERLLREERPGKAP
ncbi:MAG: ATP-binding protein [Candidatus Methylomirabilaceae bacterium]